MNSMAHFKNLYVSPRHYKNIVNEKETNSCAFATSDINVVNNIQKLERICFLILEIQGQFDKL